MRPSRLALASRRLTVSTALLALLGGAAAAPSRAAADAEVVPQALQPLAFLAGSCWTGSFPDGKQTDTHCFEWVFGGRFLRDHHVVRGAAQPYEGETLYAWNPQARRVVYTYWASDGGYSTGEVEVRGEELVFDDHYVSEKVSLELQSIWRQAGEDAYSVAVSSKKEGGWKPAWSMTLRRDAKR